MSDRIRITKIQRVNNGYRVSISGREKPLLVSPGLHQKHRLKEGIVISAAQVALLEHDAALEDCDRVVARLLAQREHSEHELTVKLKQRSFDREVIAATLRRYRDNGLLDDAHFAVAYTQMLLARRPAGASFLQAALQRKGIARELAEQTVRMVLADTDEVTLAVQALEKRRYRYDQLELERARRRAYTYLSRRGFSYAAAREAFEQLYRQTDEGTSD